MSQNSISTNIIVNDLNIICFSEKYFLLLIEEIWMKEEIYEHQK